MSDLSKLSIYFNLLYESIEQKVLGSGLILELARQPDNLLLLSENDTMIGALARVLRDDWMKSPELASNIIYIFFCFSSFDCFHSIISIYKVGALCFQGKNDNKTTIKVMRVDLVVVGDTNQIIQKNISNIVVDARNPVYEYASSEFDSFNKGRTLMISMYLLLNISESRNSEIKMLKKGLISTLLELLHRDNFELLIICIWFLKKLSIFGENIDQMLKLDILSRINPVLPSCSENFKKIAYKILLNLSFHVLVETEIMKIVLFISDGLFTNTDDATLLSIMYNISVQELDLLSSFIGDVLPLFKQWLQGQCCKGLDSRFLALLINLQHSRQIAEYFIDSSTLSIIFKGSLCDNVQGATLLKFVAIGTHHRKVLEAFLFEHIIQLQTYIPNCENEDFLVEIIHIFSYLSPSQFQFLCTSPIFHINSYLLVKLRSYSIIEDDFLLEIIMCVGRTFYCEEMLDFWLESDVIGLFLKIMKEREEDDEIVLQITYIFYILIFTLQSRDSKCYLSNISYFFELDNDKNIFISSLSDVVISIVFSRDPISAKRIVQSRFDFYNYQWIESLMDLNE